MSDTTFLSDLLVNLGCRADRAQEVISTALEDGEDPAYLRDQIEHWRAYCLGPRGQSIHAIGFFVAAKIEQNQPAPDLTPRRVDVAADWQRYLNRTLREWVTIDYMAHPAEHTPRGSVGASVAARPQEVFDQLYDLYEKQEKWIETQNALDSAADLLTSSGIGVERAPWCWSDSPYAAEIARWETLMEANHVQPS